jgi:hypothetical protein
MAQAHTHTHDHAHDHGHAPGHGQGHDHGSHYIDQLCTVAVSGALGMIAIVLFLQGSLTILAPFFQYSVLVGGILLLTITAVRGVTLWQETGKKKTGHSPGHDHSHDHKHDHAHTHEHHHDCCHDHGHHHDHAPAQGKGSTSLPVVTQPAAPTSQGNPAPEGHGHDGHNHGWAPVRYAVLLLPIILFFIPPGMPSASFNNLYNNCVVNRADGDLPSLLGVWVFGQVPASQGAEAMDVGDFKKGERGEVTGIGFKELAQGAADPNIRPFYEGKTVALKGQFVKPSADHKQFSLVRMKITCCYADAVPLNAVIASPDPVGDIAPLQWVEVTGVVHFRQLGNSQQVLPVVQLDSPADIVMTKPDLSPIQ